MTTNNQTNTKNKQTKTKILLGSQTQWTLLYKEAWRMVKVAECNQSETKRLEIRQAFGSWLGMPWKMKRYHLQECFSLQPKCSDREQASVHTVWAMQTQKTAEPRRTETPDKASMKSMSPGKGWAASTVPLKEQGLWGSLLVQHWVSLGGEQSVPILLC